MEQDTSDSVYREAASKLRVLLAATEQPTLRLGEARQRHSRSLDHLAAEAEAGDADEDGPRLFARLPPRQPSAGPGTGVRRQLFGARGRHNSWHNLTAGAGGGQDLDPEEAEAGPHQLRRHKSASLSPAAVSPGRSGAVRELVQRQELYIRQLEREAAFCKQQLATVLAQVKQVLISNSQDDAARKEEMLALVRNIEAEVSNKYFSQIVNIFFYYLSGNKIIFIMSR